MRKALFAASTLLAVAACKREPVVSTVCDLPYIPPAMRVTVQDSVTGANITPGATLVVSNGAYTDSTVAPPVGAAVSVGWGAGTYALTVRQTGYQSWMKTGIKVEGEQCTVRTIDLTARLKPSS